MTEHQLSSPLYTQVRADVYPAGPLEGVDLGQLWSADYCRYHAVWLLRLGAKQPCSSCLRTFAQRDGNCYALSQSTLKPPGNEQAPASQVGRLGGTRCPLTVTSEALQLRTAPLSPLSPELRKITIIAALTTVFWGCQVHTHVQ